MTGMGSFSCKPGQKVFMSNSESEMFLFPPAIFKPEPLWTGKQVTIHFNPSDVIKGYYLIGAFTLSLGIMFPEVHW
jgi:hypothetical protein